MIVFAIISQRYLLVAVIIVCINFVGTSAIVPKTTFAFILVLVPGYLILS